MILFAIHSVRLAEEVCTPHLTEDGTPSCSVAVHARRSHRAHSTHRLTTHLLATSIMLGEVHWYMLYMLIDRYMLCILVASYS